MPAKILLVEDDAMIRALIAALLEATAYELHEHDRGDTALETALRVKPDLILLDLGLPVRDGLDVLDDIRAHPDLAGVDVLIVTAWDDAEKMARALNAGARGYIHKPFDGATLLARIHAVIEARQSST